MFELNNDNVSRVKMTLDFKKYKLRTMFRPKNYAENILEMHLRIYPRNTYRCIFEPYFLEKMGWLLDLQGDAPSNLQHKYS